MFLYLPFQNVHWPYQVPKKYEQMYPNIKHPLRRIFSGMYNDNICIFFVQIFIHFRHFIILAIEFVFHLPFRHGNRDGRRSRYGG